MHWGKSQACPPRLHSTVRLGGGLGEAVSHLLVNPGRIQEGEGIPEAILEVQGDLEPGGRVSLCPARSYPRMWLGLASQAGLRLSLGNQG